MICKNCGHSERYHHSTANNMVECCYRPPMKKGVMQGYCTCKLKEPEKEEVKKE